MPVGDGRQNGDPGCRGRRCGDRPWRGHRNFPRHIHPFEYPREWVYQGRAWNEAYLLRAFLQFNPCFQVQLFNHYLGTFHGAELAARLPLCLKNVGGAIWLQKREVP